MLFNSLEFLIFFPIVTLLYFLIPHNLKVIFLLIASSIFYMAFKVEYILILFFLITVDYFAAFLISKAKGKKRKIYLLLSIASNLGILFYFKYFNFFFESLSSIMHFDFPTLSILLPLGLSFHTFQAMSYTIEVYKRKQKPEKNFFHYALYVMFFPQLVAGPIERPQHLLHQFYEKHYFDYERVTNGIKLIAWGFFKKIVIADRLALFVDPIYNNNPVAQSGISFIFATILFSYQIYCDFSGYSDIAVGTAKILGFRLINNFNSPYFANSPSDFWRRWHISLSSWLRDYVYIPLGGNHVPIYIWPINILITFTLSGLWHGANWTFIIWGALHGVYIIVSNFLGKLINAFSLGSVIMKWKFTRLMQIALTFCLVSFAWIFFRAKDVLDANYIATHLLKGLDSYTNDVFLYTSIYSTLPLEAIAKPILVTRGINDLIIVIIAIIAMQTVYFFQKKGDMWTYLSQKPFYIRWTAYSLLFWSIVIFGEFAKKQFIYFAF